MLTAIPTEALGLIAAHSAFDLRMLFLWMIAIPSRHPWKSVWSTTLEDANRLLLRESLSALAALGAQW